MDAQNLKNLCPKFIVFCKILKMRKKKYYEIREFFVVIVLYCSQIE